jgi:hypothetical protein
VRLPFHFSFCFGRKTGVRLLSLRNLKVRALTAPVEMVVAIRNVAEAKHAGHIFRTPSC